MRGALALAIGIAALALAGCVAGGSSDGTAAPGAYTVLAWNDLGMHCINPTFDQILVLPPFNTLWAQVVKRGDPPVIVTSGITVEYSIAVNTYSSGKRAYGGFWGTMAAPLAALMGVKVPAVDSGLAGYGLSGTMTADGDHFAAVGIPVTPVLDSGAWNPYQVALITVKDSGGATVAQTRATVPISDEMSCADCHGAADPYGDMIGKHNANEGTSLAAPVICAGCHADPALGLAGDGLRESLSAAMHGFHSTIASPPACYQCHPGPVTQCSRSTRHTASGGNCPTCHGDLTAMAAELAGGRTPWAEEPKCVTCHNGVTDVDTGTLLYRNAAGHGGLACAACHGSPHAMIPTNQVAGYPNADSYQSLQYQGFTGRAKSIGSCGVCHTSSRGNPEIADFAEEHGGSSPEQPTGCNACHTATPSATPGWPHGFEWSNSN
jgi:hypothetical protein